MQFKEYSLYVNRHEKDNYDQRPRVKESDLLYTNCSNPSWALAVTNVAIKAFVFVFLLLTLYYCGINKFSSELDVKQETFFFTSCEMYGNPRIYSSIVSILRMKTILYELF